MEPARRYARILQKNKVKEYKKKRKDILKLTEKVYDGWRDLQKEISEGYIPRDSIYYKNKNKKKRRRGKNFFLISLFLLSSLTIGKFYADLIISNRRYNSHRRVHQEEQVEEKREVNPWVVNQLIKRGAEFILYVNKETNEATAYYVPGKIITKLRVTLGSKDNNYVPGKGKTPDGVYELSKFHKVYENKELYGEYFAVIKFPTLRQRRNGIRPPNKRLLVCGTGLDERIKAIGEGRNASYGSVVTTNEWVKTLRRLRNVAKNGYIVIEHPDRPIRDLWIYEK